MKYASFFIAIGFIFGFADLLPPDHSGKHWVETEVFITNTRAFPQYKIIGYIKAVNGRDSAYVVRDSVRLFKGYKFNAFSLLAIRQSRIDSRRGVMGLDFKTIAARTTGAEIVGLDGYWAPDSTPLIKDTYCYGIQSVNDSALTVKLVKRVRHNKRPVNDTIEVYYK